MTAPGFCPDCGRPKLLDLFCCQGGASRGYDRAGWCVDGVDTNASHGAAYPFTFHHADALAYLAEHHRLYLAAAASPPCQRFTQGNAANDATHHPDLIGATRAALDATGLPYVIENVTGARAELLTPLTLCGTMFGLTATDDDGQTLHLRRHRLFESNRLLWAPGPCQHDLPPGDQWAGVYGGARRDKVEAREVRHGGYVPPSLDVLAALLGDVDGMTEGGMFECIPPAYTEWLGGLLLDQLELAA